jgi:hypothetical protein
VTLYWLTKTAASGAQLYWENNNNNFNAVEQKTQDIKVPVAITVFPGEIYQAPKSWAERAYPNLIYFNEVTKGGHFAAWEEPQLFAEELRAACFISDYHFFVVVIDKKRRPGNSGTSFFIRYSANICLRYLRLITGLVY